MNDTLSPEEVALLIRSRQILNAKGLSKDSDIKSICEAAGISRKTGYQWANNLKLSKEDAPDPAKDDVVRLKIEHEELKTRYHFLNIENEGRKLAWEIHGVDELLAAKKNTTGKSKKKRR
jgi:hypothetical protein